MPDFLTVLLKNVFDVNQEVERTAIPCDEDIHRAGRTGGLISINSGSAFGRIVTDDGKAGRQTSTQTVGA